MSSEGSWHKLKAAARRFFPVAVGAKPPDPRQLDPLYVGGPSIWVGTEQQWVDGEIPGEGAFIRGGRIIDETTAFQVGVVWACIDIQARTIAASDWYIMQRTGRKRSQELWDDPLTKLLNRRPNIDMSAVSFRRALAIGMLSWGNGYAEILRDGSNRVTGLYPIHPSRVTPFREPGEAELTYRIDNQAGAAGFIKASDMIHVKGPSIVGLMGVNKIGLAAGTIALTIATNEFASSYFTNGGRPGGVLEYPNRLDDEHFEELRKRWANRHEGPEKAFKTAILDGGLKYTSIPNDAQKGQTIESRQFQIEEIARWWGIPPHKVGHLNNASENSIEDQGKAFVNDCLRPTAREFQQEFDEKCLSKRSGLFYSKIDLDWVQEGTFKERMEGFREARNTGVLSANEIREDIGYDDMGPDGDRYIVQGAMIDLRDVGLPYKQKAAAGAKKTGAAEPVEPDEDDAEEDDQEDVVKAWLRNALVRSVRCVESRHADNRRNGHNHDSAKALALAHGTEYLQKQLVDVWPFLVARGIADDAFRMGKEVLSGHPIPEAMQAIFGAVREKFTRATDKSGKPAG